MAVGVAEGRGALETGDRVGLHATRAAVERIKDREPDASLVYDGARDGKVAQISSCVAIGDILRMAGLAKEPDVRPNSVVAWAGRRVLSETSHIEAVAKVLGARSLDRAASLIGWHWQEEAELALLSLITVGDHTLGLVLVFGIFTPLAGVISQIAPLQESADRGEAPAITGVARCPRDLARRRIRPPGCCCGSLWRGSRPHQNDQGLRAHDTCRGHRASSVAGQSDD